MASARGARFRDLSAALDAECRRRGYPLRPGAADELLASRVSAVAQQLGVQESSALKTYFGDDWPSNIADGLAESLAERAASATGAPVVMPATVAAVLTSALGVASKFAAVNAEHAQRDECREVGCQAGDAVTVFGAALHDAVESPQYEAGMAVVSIEHKEALFARDALRVFAARIADGTWRDCWCGLDDLDHLDMRQLGERVNGDLALLEQLLDMA